MDPFKKGALHGYVPTYEDAIEAIEEFSIETTSTFIVQKKTQRIGTNCKYCLSHV